MKWEGTDRYMRSRVRCIRLHTSTLNCSGLSTVHMKSPVIYPLSWNGKKGSTHREIGPPIPPQVIMQDVKTSTNQATECSREQCSSLQADLFLRSGLMVHYHRYSPSNCLSTSSPQMGALGTHLWLWSTDPICEFKAIHIEKNISMSRVIRSLRNPFVLSDNPNHNQYKDTALSWQGIFPLLSHP